MTVSNKLNTTDEISAQEVMGLSESHLVALTNDDCKSTSTESNTNHALHKNVIGPFLEMQAAAKQAGADMQICSSFRSFHKQLSIWNRKWSGELPLYTLNNKTLVASELSNQEKIHAIMLWSALPGASRHHWGSDFDVYDKASVQSCNHTLELIPSEYQNDGPCALLSTWINEHASKYGFYLPYAKYVGGVAEEPWHLSHKETAQNIQNRFVLEELYAQLEQADILGKASILKRLPSLVKRYTFNQGQ
jgi:LAS superfamily LD-carboxypeptidase LdcB